MKAADVIASTTAIDRRAIQSLANKGIPFNCVDFAREWARIYRELHG